MFRIRTVGVTLLAGLMLLMSLGCGDSDNGSSDDRTAQITWLGLTHWLVRFDDTNLLFDAYLSRPEPGATTSTEAGMEMLARVLQAEGIDSIDYILIGHTHFDHAIDAGSAALETGAQVLGSQSTCFLAQAQGLPADRCTVMGTGDEIDIGSARIRAMRTVHSNTTTIGRFAEYDAVPPEEESLWLAPNGGPVAFLVLLADGGPSIFYQNTLEAIDADDMSGEDYAENLDAVFADLAGVTLWMTPLTFVPGQAELDAYTTVVQPTFVLPHHWDALVPDLEGGVQEQLLVPAGAQASVDAAGATMVAADEYFQRLELTLDSFGPAESSPVQDAFGL